LAVAPQGSRHPRSSMVGNSTDPYRTLARHVRNPTYSSDEAGGSWWHRLAACRPDALRIRRMGQMTQICVAGILATAICACAASSMAGWRRQPCFRMLGRREGPCDVSAPVQQWEQTGHKDVGKGMAWRVVYKQGNMNVRSAKHLYSKVLGKKQWCEVVLGEQQGEWVKLVHEPGYMLISYRGLVMMRPSMVTFQKVAHNGSCADIDRLPITDGGTCHTAALALGLRRPDVTQGRAGRFDVEGPLDEHGCLAFEDNSVLASGAFTLCRSHAGADEKVCTQHNTTSTTTTTVTGPSTTTVTREPSKDPTLFCFMVVTKNSGIEDILTVQLSNQASIFGCEEHLLISYGGELRFREGETAELPAPGIPAGDAAALEQATHLASVMVQVWEVVFADGRCMSLDWTVKVEPDVVFLPDRLRAYLHPNTSPQGKLLYVLNCDRFPGPPLLLGSLEVVARRALERYSHGLGTCKGLLPSWHTLNEAKFMQHCLELLGVGSMVDSDLISDDECWASPCTNLSKTAFHVERDANSYMRCWEQATEANLAATWDLDFVKH